MMPDIDTVATHVDAEGFSFDAMLQKAHLSREALVEIVLYFGIGFIVGFLCKKYNHYLLWFALVAVILAGLHYFELITLTIHVDKIKSLFGCSASPLDAGCVSVFMNWTKEHLRASLSFMSGIVIGIWVG